AGKSAPSRSTRSNPPPPAAPRHGRPGHRSCSFAPCSGWNRSGSIWSWTPRSPAASDGSNCSTSRGDGGGWTPSAEGGSTSRNVGRVDDDVARRRLNAERLTEFEGGIKHGWSNGWEPARGRAGRVRHHRRPRQGDDVPLPVPAGASRPARLSDRRGGGRRLVRRRSGGTGPEVDHGHGR